LYRHYQLEEFGVSFPEDPDDSYHVYNQFTGRFPRRNELLAYLRERGVGAAIYYPLPLHLQPCFAYLGYRKGDLPEAEKAVEEVLSLPVFPEMTEVERVTVVQEIRQFYEKGV
jgi:dTDP-4-amino-4,6-dideoxygalactose transaminase